MSDSTILPENYVEPPDILGMVMSPGDPAFWQDWGRTWDWIKYIWVGPAPNIVIDVNSVYPKLQFSPQSIYEEMIEAVGELKIPGVDIGPQIFHEGGPFSPYRAYLRIRREFSEFLVCAAPVGKSFFITVRKIDRFPHVKWFHYILAAVGLTMIMTLAVTLFGFVGGLVFFSLLLALAWSLMRYASHMTMSWLGEVLPGIPVIGGLYLRWFRPDTYFRQDLHMAFAALVEGAIKDVIAGMVPGELVRPATEHHGGPILKDLHNPG